MGIATRAAIILRPIGSGRVKSFVEQGRHDAAAAAGKGTDMAAILRACVLAACALGGFEAFGDARAQRASADGVAWREDFEAALKEAADSKKPIFVLFLMENEVANDEVADLHLHDPDVVKLSREFVCLIANPGSHDPDASGKCSKFGSCTCKGHQGADMAARAEYTNSPRVVAPQFLFLAPDGKTVLVRRLYTIPAADLVRKMRTALARLDPKKADPSLDEEKKLVDELLAKADSNNASTRADALQTLATFDDPRVVEFLARQTGEDVDEAKRLEAVHAIADRGSANGLLLPTLHKLVASRSARMRSNAVVALRKIGAPDSAPVLAAALRKESKDRVRACIFRALAVCDSVTPEYRKLLIAGAKSGGQTERTSALRALADVPSDPEVDKVLVTAVKESSNALRAAAYYSLGVRDVKSAADVVARQAAVEKATDMKKLGALAAEGLKSGASFDAAAADSLVSLFLVEGL
jgi:HEAT repeat protein